METTDKNKEVFYQIRIEKDLKNSFVAYCKENGFNSSAIVRKLIAEWLEKQQTK